MNELPTWIAALFDRYSRVARVYPALIVVLPVCWTALAIAPTDSVDMAASSAAIGFVVSVLLVLFANLARSRGKAIEPTLIAAWGGRRTTVLLRHRDATINRYTKARYHAALSRLCGLPFPTAAEELADKPRADDLYRSATDCLIELRRDRKYSLLHKENAQYGLRRNLLGLKWPAVVILAAAVLAVLAPLVNAAAEASLFPDLTDTPTRYVAGGANLAMLMLWLTMIRQTFVRQAADDYAFALFRTLEEPGP